MKKDDFALLFRRLVESSMLDEETASALLERIMSLLFPTGDSDTKPPGP